MESIKNLKPADLEDYQAKRRGMGLSDAYVDQEIGTARAMVNKAFDNDLVGGEAVKAFRKLKKFLKRNSNARERILSRDEFERLISELPRHSRAIVATAFYTGMRQGEILALRWEKVDFKERLIRLESSDTKDREPRNVPICDELLTIL